MVVPGGECVPESLAQHKGVSQQPQGAQVGGFGCHHLKQALRGRTGRQWKAQFPTSPGPRSHFCPWPDPRYATSCMRFSWALRVSRRPLARTAGSSCHRVFRGPGGRGKVGASPGVVGEGLPSSLTPHSSSDSTAAR